MTNRLKPESLMMSFGYKSELSEGAIKCPIFQTSTFSFKSAEEGKRFFEIAYGLKEKDENEELGLIYSRINNPDIEILENRLSLWNNSESSAVFESGMSAISTVILEFLEKDDVLLYSKPLYGGTDHFIHSYLYKIGAKSIGFNSWDELVDILSKLKDNDMYDKLKMIFIESPANPTNALYDFEILKKLKDNHPNKENIKIVVDNTYLGPIWQNPLEHGADILVYSATKYIGGHSDLIAGAVLGNKADINRVKTLRTFFGNLASPWTSWLIMRSLETLKIRMEQIEQNANKVAEFLNSHKNVEKVNHLSLLIEGSRDKNIFDKQCIGTGGMISIYIKGGEKEAFDILNKLKLIHLAVSLGSTESLVQHPKTMTHVAVNQDDMKSYGITDNLIRISVGVEYYEDIISDLKQALEY